MIKTLIASTESFISQSIENLLSVYCPQVEIGGVASSWDEALTFFQTRTPDLLFIEKAMACLAGDLLSTDCMDHFEVIILHPDSDLSAGALSNTVVGHLFSPLQPKEFVTTVHNTVRLIRWKKEWLESKQLLLRLVALSASNDRIGIPTLDGMVFLKTQEILRCEGLHRFTRVCTTLGTSIISSYNIGEFCKFLCDYGFFAPHKSHLINLRHIARYKTEGTILMQDGSYVPVSRRRKTPFLECVKHI